MKKTNQIFLSLLFAMLVSVNTNAQVLFNYLGGGGVKH
jgi:hypothetical protein